MAGQKKLHAAKVASQKKTLKNPNEEDSGAILFHSLAIVKFWVKVSYPVGGTPCVLNRGGLTNHLEGFTSRLQQPELGINPRRDKRD
jgi:hypothetical protein